MRIIFCDDNSIILDQLQSYVMDFFRNIGGTMPEFATYASGDLLLENEKAVDIAFLDVEMPGRSGIHVGAKLKEINPQIKIFIVTSYPDYLDEAMRFQVFRYLSKPIDKSRLFRNLKDAVFQYNMASKEYPILTSSGVFVRRSEEIICIEAVQRKVLVHTTTGTLRTTKAMEHWRTVLTLPCFFLTHRSFIVNMRFVKTINKDKVLLQYNDQLVEAYLARRRYTYFKDTYLMYLESSR